MIEIPGLSMASKSFYEISSTLKCSLSRKMLIPWWYKTPIKILVKLLRVSSPLKFTNTSYLHWWVKEEEESPLLTGKAMVIWIDSRTDLKGRGEFKWWNWNCKGLSENFLNGFLRERERERERERIYGNGRVEKLDVSWVPVIWLWGHKTILVHV